MIPLIAKTEHGIIRQGNNSSVHDHTSHLKMLGIIFTDRAVLLLGEITESIGSARWSNGESIYRWKNGSCSRTRFQSLYARDAIDGGSSRRVCRSVREGSTLPKFFARISESKINVPYLRSRTSRRWIVSRIIYGAKRMTPRWKTWSIEL